MEQYNDWELWVSDKELLEGEDSANEGEEDIDPTFFTLKLSPEGQPGGFKVRNPPGTKQRPLVSEFHAGRRRRPAFDVQCNTRAIIHGTLTSAAPQKKATLFVYDFQFLSYRGARIKDATIILDFLPSAGAPAGSRGPSIWKVAPETRYTVMETSQVETRKQTVKGGLSGGAVLQVNGEAGLEKTVEKTTTFAAEITGTRVPDNYGNYHQAHWELQENHSEAKGIVTFLRTCILLVRENDNDFDCAPYVRVTPDLTTRLVSLASGRSRDEAIPYDPSYEPYNELEQLESLDRWNLASVDLNKLWDCTFSTTFGGAIKSHTAS